jgi:uncharacterized protein
MRATIAILSLLTLSWMAFPTFADLNDSFIKAALKDSADDRLWNAAGSGDLEGVKAALEDGADVVGAHDGQVLHRAVYGENPDVVSLLLRRGAKVSIADRTGDTPLVNAISGFGLSDPHRVAIAEILIANGASVRRPNKDGWTPIHWAASYGQPDIIKLLLAKGADINALDAEGKTPLDVVADPPLPNSLLQARDCADYLLAHGARVGGTSANGKRPLAGVDRELFMAAIAGNAEGVRQAVARGAHVNLRDSLSRSPLIWAAELGRLEASKALLDNRADLELADYASRTPLHAAAEGGFPKLVELLLARGANINATDQWSRRTPLGVVADAETAVVLLRAGANANNPDLLCLAIFRGDGKLVELLLSYGADTNAKCGSDTPLLSAIGSEKWDIVSILLDHGADANLSTPLAAAADTPLTAAAERPASVDAVARLLERGANPNTPDSIGETALIKAVWPGRANVIKVLLDHGANAGVKGITGLTALGMAPNDVEIADLLISHGANVDDLIPGLLGQDARLDNHQRAVFRAVVIGDVRGAATALPNMAEISKPLPGGLPPLALATALARINVTDWLLEHGANANAPDADGMAPLHRAVIAVTREPQQKIRLIGSLLKHGASIDVTENRYGMTPSHLAAATFNREVADFLLRNGADPMRRTKQGYTPMQLAQRSRVYGSGWLGSSVTQEDLKPKSATIETLRRAVSSRPIGP